MDMIEMAVVVAEQVAELVWVCMECSLVQNAAQVQVFSTSMSDQLCQKQHDHLHLKDLQLHYCHIHRLFLPRLQVFLHNQKQSSLTEMYAHFVLWFHGFLELLWVLQGLEHCSQVLL